jgi:large subunit ribosomal protein L1
MDKTIIQTAIDKALEGKGKKKFSQTVEAIFNFKGIDTSKPENRVNLDVQLPKGRGKVVPVVVFGDTAVALEAQKAGAKAVLDAAGIAKLAANPSELKRLAKECEFISAPNMMVVVGKNLGQVLGSRGRLPRPIVGNVAEAMKNASSRVRLVTRGKYLPTVQCAIGSEAMSSSDLVENFEAVYEKVKNKVGEASMGAIYVKLTMGTAVKVGAGNN